MVLHFKDTTTFRGRNGEVLDPQGLTRMRKIKKQLVGGVAAEALLSVSKSMFYGSVLGCILLFIVGRFIKLAS